MSSSHGIWMIWPALSHDTFSKFHDNTKEGNCTRAESWDQPVTISFDTTMALSINNPPSSLFVCPFDCLFVCFFSLSGCFHTSLSKNNHQWLIHTLRKPLTVFQYSIHRLTTIKHINILNQPTSLQDKQISKHPLNSNTRTSCVTLSTTCTPSVDMIRS